MLGVVGPWKKQAFVFDRRIEDQVHRFEMPCFPSGLPSRPFRVNVFVTSHSNLSAFTMVTDAQKEAVGSMVEYMMNVKPKPASLSFTMEWDVVPLYSESQLNRLLADRHGKAGDGKIQEIAFEDEIYDERHSEQRKFLYRMSFGSPLIQFDAKLKDLPLCSLHMEVVSGTKQFGDGGTIYDLPKDWSIRVNNVLLAAVRGEMLVEHIVLLFNIGTQQEGKRIHEASLFSNFVNKNLEKILFEHPPCLSSLQLNIRPEGRANRTSIKWLLKQSHHHAQT